MTTLLAGTLIPIVIAYQHRKQMRQIELYRGDQSVGLKAPAIPPIAFLKRHGWQALALTFSTIGFGASMLSPSSLKTILIAWGVNNVFWCLRDLVEDP